MSNSFKEQAKSAKERLCNGFWDEVHSQCNAELEVAATTGESPIVALSCQKEKVRNLIYNEKYSEEQIFYNKVVSIMESKELVVNPLALLADEKYLAALDARQKQAYMLNLSNKYRQAVEKYRKQKNL